MPVRKFRKRYILFNWQSDRPGHPTREEFERLINRSDNDLQRESGRPETRLLIHDQRLQMGIAKTTHTSLERVKQVLEDEKEGWTIKVISVSGSIKKLKARMSKAADSVRA